MPERPADPPHRVEVGVALSGTGRAGGRLLVWRKAEAFGIQDLKSGGWRNRGTTPRQPNGPGRITQDHERAYTRPMSNLIAKIRHWLHLDKKPKT